jgi:hypothetical protein
MAISFSVVAPLVLSWIEAMLHIQNMAGVAHPIYPVGHFSEKQSQVFPKWGCPAESRLAVNHRQPRGMVDPFGSQTLPRLLQASRRSEVVP